MSAYNRKTGVLAKKRWKSTIDRLVSSVGNEVVVYLSDTEYECPNCYFDKINKYSSGVCKTSPGDPNYFIHGRCPVCNGKGVLVVSRKRHINAMILWNPSGGGQNSLTFTEAGYEGATIVEIKTDPCNLDIIKACKYVIIDGVTCKLSGAPLIRGLGEKSVMVVQFFTTNKPKPDNGEVA
jgi:hypothetical protein